MTRKITLFLVCSFEVSLILFFVACSAWATETDMVPSFNDDLSKYGDTNPEMFSCAFAKSKAIDAIVGAWFHEQTINELVEQKNKGEIGKGEFERKNRDEQIEIAKWAEISANYSTFFATFCKK